MLSKNCWPPTNLSFIYVLSFRTRNSSKIALPGGCIDNGRLFETVYVSHKPICADSIAGVWIVDCALCQVYNVSVMAPSGNTA
jgi:hypothetical protein